jgi:hypothetical protein
MSLKAFHIVFVAVSTLFCVAFGAWSLRLYLLSKIQSDLAYACGGAVCAIVLIIYGVWFFRKLKNISFL